MMESNPRTEGESHDTVVLDPPTGPADWTRRLDPALVTATCIYRSIKVVL